ncbi:MAG: IMP dehydrogenase, partial [Chromatiales bacterium]|nr:IMP dehydrogenase [Chromatiales bacterium]
MRIAQEAFTFDDVLLVPAHSQVMPKEVQLKTQLTRNIELNIPLLSAAMDTVTESRLAITMAQEGGIGIIHKNMTIDQHAAEVRKVKRYESGIVKDPITVSSNATVRDVMDLTRKLKISGVPVVDGDNLVGIVTNRDLRFEGQLDASITSVMTPKEKLVTVKEGADRDEVLSLLHQHRIERILVVNDAFHLRGLITVKDIQKETEKPQACKDSSGSLLV